jgi:hypothetical protein
MAIGPRRLLILGYSFLLGCPITRIKMINCCSLVQTSVELASHVHRKNKRKRQSSAHFAPREIFLFLLG